MIAKQIVKHLMEKIGFRQVDMVESLDKQFGQQVTVQSLNERISTRRSTSLTTANLNMMLHVLGYKVVVMPQGLPTPSGSFELDDGLTPKAEGETK